MSRLLRPTLLRPLALARPSHQLARPMRRFYSSDAESSMSPTESEIASSLSSHDALRPISSVLVKDVSGGCGSMYAIDVASAQFKGKGLLAQQRLVTKALGDRVKEWHGVQIRTSVPEDA